ncbi:MAG TPA: Rieske (2Fe-2S) protein [Candidatus Obscuribacterales bacterium]
MNRRDFMSWIGAGALASSLPVAIAACQSDPGAAGEFTDVAPVADLDGAGFVAAQGGPGQEILVVRNPADATALIAVNATCPHAGCSVAWEGAMFACPCHDSRFNPDGTVAGGPATAALTTYEAKVEGDRVLVKMG